MLSRHAIAGSLVSKGGYPIGNGITLDVTVYVCIYYVLTVSNEIERKYGTRNYKLNPKES
jgi:hypothetical protein